MKDRKQCGVCGEFVTCYVELGDERIECIDCIKAGLICLSSASAAENTLYHPALRKEWGYYFTPPVVKASLPHPGMKPVSLHVVERKLRGVPDVEDLMED